MVAVAASGTAARSAQPCRSGATQRGQGVAGACRNRTYRGPEGPQLVLKTSRTTRPDPPPCTSLSCTAMGAAPRTVLIVDDDAVLRSSLDSVLGSLRYRVLSTGSPEAVQLPGDHGLAGRRGTPARRRRDGRVVATGAGRSPPTRSRRQSTSPPDPLRRA